MAAACPARAAIVPDIAIKAPAGLTPAPAPAQAPAGLTPAPAQAPDAPVATNTAVTPVPVTSIVPPSAPAGAPTPAVTPAGEVLPSPASTTTDLATHAGAATDRLSRAAGGLNHAASAAAITKDVIAAAPASTAALVRGVVDTPASSAPAGAAAQLTQVLVHSTAARLSQSLSTARQTVDVDETTEAVLGSSSGGHLAGAGRSLGQTASAVLGHLPGVVARQVGTRDSLASAGNSPTSRRVAVARTLRVASSSAAGQRGGALVSRSSLPAQLAAAGTTSASDAPFAGALRSLLLPCFAVSGIARSRCQSLWSALLATSDVSTPDARRPTVLASSGASRDARRVGDADPPDLNAPGGPSPAAASSSGVGAAGPAPLLLLLSVLCLGAAASSRRLRFARMPLRPAPFALIPARPG